MQHHALIKGIADISKRPARQYYFGIDLGTTNSSIAAFDVFGLAGATMPVSIVGVEQPTDQGSKISPLFPSVVFCRPDGSIICGEGARVYRKRPAVRGRNIFYSVKSEMGLGREPFYVDAEDSRLDTPYKVSGQILAALRSAAEEAYGVDVTDRIVVTVPASFQSSQRVDTLRAAQLAGFRLDATDLRWPSEQVWARAIRLGKDNRCSTHK